MSIEMKALTKSFGEPPVQVLKGISGEIKNGEMVAILGRSGSGKSTLLYIISSLDRPSTGEVMIDGASLSHMNQKQLHQFRNQKMGFVFQFHHLLPELNALENVMMPTLKATFDLAQRVERKKFARELLAEFGIADKEAHLPSQLSGGEQQRVAIARALVMQPEFIFADEPTGNLDSINGQMVMNLLQRINRERGTTIVYVTHDQIFAGMATRQIHMTDGTLS